MSKGKFVQPGFDEFGRQIPDNTPVEVPIHIRRVDPREEVITRLIRRELSARAGEVGYETLEESDDFDVDDLEDVDAVSAYELNDMQADAPFEERVDSLPAKQAGQDSPAKSRDGRQPAEPAEKSPEVDSDGEP